MKEGFRQSMAWLHTWLGLIVGWVLYYVYLTGNFGYVDREIDYWMTPDKPYFSVMPGPRVQLQMAQQRLEEVAPDAAVWNILVGGDREQHSLDISWTERAAPGTRGATRRETLDPQFGTPVDNSARATGGGQLLYKMHYNLAYMPLTTANILIMICSVIMFSGMITGIITHRNIFKDFFTFRPRKGARSWLDGHNMLSVSSLPFHLIVTYSGLLFFMYQFMPAVPHLVYDESAGSVAGQLYRDTYGPTAPPVDAAAGTPAQLVSLASMLDEAERLWGKGMVASAEVRNPGDANARAIFRPLQTQSIAFPDDSLVFDGSSGALIEEYPGPYTHPAGYADQVLKGLHKGLFAAPFLRVLYIFMGFAGTAMIGTGLLLWSNRRKARLLERQQDPHFGIRLVDCLNLGTIIGLWTAIAAYFWANRLLPPDFAERAAWEVHAMYLTLAAALLHPVLRPLQKAWIEQLWIAAAAYALLPLVNALTTERHLGNSIEQGDWIMAGFDLCALATGFVFAIFALRLQRKQAAARVTAETGLQANTAELAVP